MKHAYLILAHGNRELLRTLIATLDDPRNDIFVHIDAKVAELPELAASRANLTVLGNRVDVRWGDVSVVEAEYALFEAAVAAGPYEYYHLLSGVDLPLKSQDWIHSFCGRNAGREFIGYTSTEMTPETVRKARRWHLFPRSFRRRSILRAAFLRIQEALGIYRNRTVEFKKGSQWCSVTDAMAHLFLENREWAMRTFSHTFCADEMVMQTLCWHSPLRGNIYSLEGDGEGCMRAIGWRDGCLVDWARGDFDALARSGAMFARKFNLSDRGFVRDVVALTMGETTPASPAVSVIIPVHNAAATIGRSLDSLRAQSMKDFEAVIVDDCSTDGSSELIDEFARNSGVRCKVLRQPVNNGVAAARNRGLDAAEGEYVAWLDADDALMPDALAKALDAARPLVPGTGADIVGFDWRLGFESNSRYMRQADWNSPLEALKALMGGTARWNLWLFLLRREFVESAGLRFLPGADMGEDMAFMIKAFANAGRAVQIHGALYLYNAVNSGSISRFLDSKRRAEVSANITKATETVALSPYSAELSDWSNYLKLYVKLPLLIGPSTDDYRLWHSWMDEANPWAAKNKALPLRTRALQWMAWKKLWGGVRAYHFLVYKFVYGVIFR